MISLLFFCVICFMAALSIVELRKPASFLHYCTFNVKEGSVEVLYLP